MPRPSPVRFFARGARPSPVLPPARLTYKQGLLCVLCDVRHDRLRRRHDLVHLPKVNCDLAHQLFLRVSRKVPFAGVSTHIGSADRDHRITPFRSRLPRLFVAGTILDWSGLEKDGGRRGPTYPGTSTDAASIAASVLDPASDAAWEPRPRSRLTNCW